MKDQTSPTDPIKRRAERQAKSEESVRNLFGVAVQSGEHHKVRVQWRAVAVVGAQRSLERSQAGSTMPNCGSVERAEESGAWSQGSNPVEGSQGRRSAAKPAVPRRTTGQWRKLERGCQPAT